jgi:hypothetical protein
VKEPWRHDVMMNLVSGCNVIAKSPLLLLLRDSSAAK